MTKDKIERDVRFALKIKQLKPGEHFTVEAMIGGGQKVARVSFTDPKHIGEHREHLEQVARNGEFTVELRAA